MKDRVKGRKRVKMSGRRDESGRLIKKKWDSYY